MRWFTADQHFGHRRIIKLCGRPFVDVDEMDAELARQWNAAVEPTDEVWVLGDIAEGQLSVSLPKVHELNGTKHLVVGNHDRPFVHRGDQAKHDYWVDRYLNQGGFADLCDQAHLVIGGQHVRLSHFPYLGDSRHSPDRYPAARPADDGSWLLHGHVHGRWLRRGRQINVGVDRAGFAPVAEPVLAAIIGGG